MKPTRRHFVGAALAGSAALTAGCAGDGGYEAAARDLRQPLRDVHDNGALLRELVRCATLAANGHNTQPWAFTLADDTIWVQPDFSRRTPVVDPDDHHLWVSLGCAVENLVLAAQALGRRAETVTEAGGIRVRLARAAPQRPPAADAIFTRQCTRGVYDGQPLPSAWMDRLRRAAERPGVQLQLLTARDQIDTVIDYVLQGNSAQLRDPAFVAELKAWVRFSGAQAVARGDGLFARASGNPALPGWLGGPLFDLFFTEKSENDRYAEQLRSSAAVAVLSAERADPAHWVEVGRACQRLALVATTLDIRHAFVNQPVEVPALRGQFASWLGLGAQRPDLVLRFGRGAMLPYSLRRPLAQVLV